AALEPVLRDDALDVRHDWPLDPRHHVAPHRLSPGALEPPVRHARAADERDAAIDDEQLAMGAIVEARQAVPLHAPIPLDTAAGAGQLLSHRAKGAEAAARIEHN